MKHIKNSILKSISHVQQPIRVKHNLFNYFKLLCHLNDVNFVANLKDVGKIFLHYKTLLLSFLTRQGLRHFGKLHVTDKYFSQNY